MHVAQTVMFPSFGQAKLFQDGGTRVTLLYFRDRKAFREGNVLTTIPLDT